LIQEKRLLLQAADAARTPPLACRLPQVALAAAGIVICYADRSNMSTAIIPMSQDLGWDKAYQGVVLSAFFAGYATTQILGGARAHAACL
jgi:ACS family sodium-dependent inorganic phosphate cotransporter